MRTLNKLLATAMALMVPLCTWAQTETEPNNTSGTANPVTYNTPMTGSMGVCSPTDNSTDYFSLAVTTQGQLRVQSTMSNTGPVDLEVTFRVRQASTSILADFALTAGANGVPVNDSFTFPCHGGTGTYFIEVLNPSASFCTNYSFAYDFIAPVFSNDPEPNNGSGAAAVIVPVSTQQAGQINFFYGDNVDWYRLDLPTHGVLNIQWEAEHVGTNDAGTVAATLRQSSTSAITTWNLPVGANSLPSSQTVSIDCRSNSGFYYLSLVSNTCGTSYRFSYTVTPPLFANDAEPNDGSGTAITLAVNTPTQGQINFSTYTENADYYRLDLPTQGVLNIHWEAENAGTNGAGTVAATLRQSSTSAITTWNLPVGASSVASSQTVSIDCRSNTGFYYLSLASNICGVSYRFSYTVTPPIFTNDVEPNNGSGSATAIPHSTPTQGQINFSTYVENADYYRLDLPTSGILNIHWEAEHTSATPGSATLNLRQASTSLLQSWTVPVGASSIPASQTVSINCRGNQNHYFLEVSGVSCGISYQLSYTVTPPIYGIAPATGTTSGGATTIDLETATVEGQIGFFYGQPSAYYRIVHTGGPIVLSMMAEHAGAAAADYSIRLRAASTSVLQTETRSAGGNSTPLSATVDFGVRGAANYFIEVYDAPCGMSYAIHCNDADGDGVCNAYDLCPGTPNGDGVNSDGCACSQLTVDDNDVCTLDACLNGNVTHTFQDADNDLTCDANDGCPNDPNKIAPGACGCGNPDVPTTWYADTDGDGLGDPNSAQAGFTCDQPIGYVSNSGDACPAVTGTIGSPCDDGDANTTGDVIDSNCDCHGSTTWDCPALLANIGDPCDDGNANTTGDVVNASCNCTGTPIGNCTENLFLNITLDNFGAETTWEVRDQTGTSVVASGGPYQNNMAGAIIIETLCLEQLCYRLVVSDAGGNGINGGGYVLLDTDGNRLIDNAGNFSAGSTSAIGTGYDNGNFCLPIGTDKPIFSSCDKLDWVANKFIVAAENPAVSAQYGVTNTTSGYEFWFFDPNGGYNFRRFRSHATSDGYGTGALRANHFKVNGWTNSVATPHLPDNVLLNVRVRGRVAGTNLPFGPASQFKLDAALAACPKVKLQDDAAFPDEYSCGVIRNFGGSSNANNRITAKPPQPVPTVASSSVRYQFRFRIAGENICIVRPAQTSARLVLNWTNGPALQATKTYDVDVRVSLDGGATWCFGPATADQAAACADTQDWGKVCQVTISGSSAQMQGGSTSLTATGNSTFTLYPNPNQGDQLFVSISSVEKADIANVDIYDLTGKRVVARSIAVQDGMVNTNLDLQGSLASGVYVVHINAGAMSHTERLVIQK